MIRILSITLIKSIIKLVFQIRNNDKNDDDSDDRMKTTTVNGSLFN